MTNYDEKETKILNKIADEIVKFDGYEVVRDGNFYKVRELSGTIVEVENRFEKSEVLSELLIEEQIQKCREKINIGDYSGAITNARTLIEAVCVNIEHQLDPNPQGNDGDLMKLFNRVRKLLNLDPSKDISDSLKQVINGLTSIINGLATMRNKMSDATESVISRVGIMQSLQLILQKRLLIFFLTQ
mgnify:CR=1 FL=1